MRECLRVNIPGAGFLDNFLYLPQEPFGRFPSVVGPEVAGVTVAFRVSTSLGRDGSPGTGARARELQDRALSYD